VDGMKFHNASAEMARRLHLVDDTDGRWWLSPPPPGCDGDIYERASSAVAWSVHNWQLYGLRLSPRGQANPTHSTVQS